MRSSSAHSTAVLNLLHSATVILASAGRGARPKRKLTAVARESWTIESSSSRRQQPNSERRTRSSTHTVNLPLLRTREYDFKSFIKRIVSGPTLGRHHNTIGIYIHGSGHKLSMWYHVVLGHSAESLLVLITLRGRRFEPFARRQRISLLVKGITDCH